MSEQTLNLVSMMEERVKSLIEKGDWEGAENTAKTAIQSATERYEQDSSHLLELVKSLEILGQTYQQGKEQQKASHVYSNIIQLLDGQPGYHEEKGGAGANLAVIYEDQELHDEAKDFYKWSISEFEQASPPCLLDVAGLLNNLAFLYETEQRYKRAEECFLKALKIKHDVLTAKHEETADLWNNLGALYYKTEKYDQALEMHKSALDVRVEVLGARHTDTGQSWGNIALVHAELQDIEAAKECFSTALETFENAPDVKMTDYATINTNFVQILERQGHVKEADVVRKRVGKYMKTRS